LTDFNSTSGSYVNFKPVDTHGVSLQHADLVHFGGLLFRFNSATRTQNASTKTEQEI
jgi:pSer/pThr/pTyr-binding forkhead associated (FHA) protein